MATAQFLWIHEVSFDFLMSYDKMFTHEGAKDVFCNFTSVSKWSHTPATGIKSSTQNH